MQLYKSLINKGIQDGIIKNVVGAIIKNEDNKILVLTRKNDDFMGGIDELPSGNMEQNESIKQALIREVKEETNLNVIKIANYINSFDYISGSGKKARQYNFLVEVDDAEIVLTEHCMYKWQTVEETLLNPKITAETKLAIEIYKFNFNN